MNTIDSRVRARIFKVLLKNDLLREGVFLDEAALHDIVEAARPDPKPHFEWDDIDGDRGIFAVYESGNACVTIIHQDEEIGVYIEPQEAELLANALLEYADSEDKRS